MAIIASSRCPPLHHRCQAPSTVGQWLHCYGHTKGSCPSPSPDHHHHHPPESLVANMHQSSSNMYHSITLFTHFCTEHASKRCTAKWCYVDATKCLRRSPEESHIMMISRPFSNHSTTISRLFHSPLRMKSGLDAVPWARVFLSNLWKYRASRE